MLEAEVLESYVYTFEDCFGFFVTGLAFGLLFAGIFFLVGLGVRWCLKLISMTI